MLDSTKVWYASRAILGPNKQLVVLACACVFAGRGVRYKELFQVLAADYNLHDEHCLQVASALVAATLQDPDRSEVWLKLAQQYLFSDEQPKFLAHVVVKEVPLTQGIVLGILESLNELTANGIEAPKFRSLAADILVRCFTEKRCNNSHLEFAGRSHALQNGKFLNRLSTAAKTLAGSYMINHYDYLPDIIKQAVGIFDQRDATQPNFQTLGDVVLKELVYALCSSAEPWHLSRMLSGK